MKRDDLPADPAEAIATVDARRAELAATDQDLVLLRAELLRELVGDGRGGKQRAAQVLGVSWTQVQRALGEDVTRRVRAAIESADLDRDAYVVRVVGDHAEVRLSTALLDDAPRRRTARWVALGNTAGNLLTALRRAGLDVAGDDRSVDDGNFGPTPALVRGDVVEVSVTKEQT